MSLISAQNLGRSFGPVDIFEGIDLSIPHNARIAIVGSNGVGKTTLLRILAGEDEPSEGSVFRSRGLRIGYLPQEAVLETEGTLWESCVRAFEDLLEMADELHSLEVQMQDPNCDAAVLTRYGNLQHQFEIRGGYNYSNLIQQTLTGLGFSPDDYQRPLSQLSGGQRTRARLARILLENPDLLFLDEPSNHLDISAVEWLEAYLRDWSGAVVIVSHDRYFLDQTARVIWEMTPSLEVYRGNYSAYLRQREERYARRLIEFEAQTEFIEKQEEYIRRNLGSQNNNQARGRQRRLERLLEDSRLTAPMHHERQMHMRLKPVGRSGDLVLRTFNLYVGYEDEGRPLFQSPDLVLERGECVALIGPNGAGKTTFMKTILGQTPPYSGETLLGSSLKVGYFAQAHEDLDPTNNLIQEINTVAPNMLPAEARNYLARYGFHGDQVFDRVATLSGGERGRLALAILALSDANLLLLDEPTNHLDLPTQEVLQSVLADYPGTILLVSHDRYLIDALATQIWELLPAEERLQVFKGSYSEYKEFLSGRNKANPAATVDLSTSEPGVQEEDKRIKKSLSRNQRQHYQKKLDSLEGEIQKLEAEKAGVENQLAAPPKDVAKLQKVTDAYQSLSHRLENLLKEWEELAKILHEDEE